MIAKVRFSGTYSPNEVNLIKSAITDDSVTELRVEEAQAAYKRKGERILEIGGGYSLYEVDVVKLCALGIVGWDVVEKADRPVLEALMNIAAKVDALYSRGPIAHSDVMYNDRCNVHVPGLGLLLIDEVKVHESMCTEELQVQLDDGWRIIACCPQPDSRRPDYVLGRSKSTS